jgi:hypothetical protein
MPDKSNDVVKQYVTDKGVDFMVNVAAVILGVLIARLIWK